MPIELKKLLLRPGTKNAIICQNYGAGNEL